MLEQLRNSSQSGIIYFLFAIIIVVFIFTFNTSGPGGGCTGGEEWTAAKVNGDSIKLSELELGMRLSANPPQNPLDSFGSAIYQGTRFARLGLSRPDLPTPYTPSDTYTRPSESGVPVKAQKVMDDLIEMYLVSQEAEKLGLRVSDQELAEAVRGWIESEQGEFTSSGYSNTIRYGLTTTRQTFESFLSRELLRRKLVLAVASQGTVAPSVVDHYVGQLNETATVRYTVISPESVASQIAVSPADATAYAASNQDALTAAYEARKAEFNQPEKLQLSGIFKKAPFPAQIENEKDATRKAELEGQRNDARAALETMVQQLNDDAKAAATEQAAAAAAAAVAAEQGLAAPAPAAARADLFAQLAKDGSDDATKAKGGLFANALSQADLGRYPYGEAVAAGAFALQQGAVSQVIEVNRGFWILRLEDKVAAVSNSMDDVKAQLATDLIRNEKAPALVESTATAFLAAAEKSAATPLTDVAAAFGGAKDLETQESLPLARLRGLGDNKAWKEVGGLGCTPDMVEAAFELTEEAPLAKKVFTVFSGPACDTDTGKRVVAQLVSKTSPTAEELPALQEQVKGQLTEFQKLQTYRAWYAELAAKADISVSPEFEQYVRLQEPESAPQ